MQALVLFGPTAVGKTAALHAAAIENPHILKTWELISADSRQVYRGLDVGTAKPSEAERREIPHHLIDVKNPDERCDVGFFVRRCDELVPEIRARKHVPVISGGTAFYLQAYLCGLPETPPPSEDVREMLQRRAEREGANAVYRELQRLDPESAARIEPGDLYRVLRALEVYHSTGRPRSSFREPRTRRPGVETRVIGLHRDRESLYRRINERVDEMFDRGLVDEVTRLYRAGYRPDDPGLRTIGYREFFEAGGLPPWSRETLRDVRCLIARNTRRFAKRQEVFFRRLPDVLWIDAADTAAVSEILTDAIMAP